MAKRSIWLTDEDLERLERVQKAMQGDPTLRQLDLGWSDVLRILLRQALENQELKYFRKLPKGLSPKDALRSIERTHHDQREIVLFLIRSAERQQAVIERTKREDEEKREQRKKKSDE